MGKLLAIVADDIPAPLRMTVRLLEDRCEVVATAGDGFEAIDAIRRIHPEIAVLDLSMPGLNGLEVARKAIQEQPTLRVIICSVHRDQAYIDAALEVGAKGYVCKMNLYRDLNRAVDTVAAGGVFFPTAASIQTDFTLSDVTT